jgi:hypothetical protein
MPVITPLVLNEDRSIRSGSTVALATAIGRGADLKVATTFRHNEHIDTRWALVGGDHDATYAGRTARRLWAAAVHVLFPL